MHETMMVQFNNIPRLDRENIIHWKLAQEYSKDILKNCKLEKELNFDVIKDDIEQLYNRFRLDIRGLHMKIKNERKPLTMNDEILYDDLILGVTDSHSLTGHQARSEKLPNDICSEWCELKQRLDLKFKEALEKNNEQSDLTTVCFCALRSLDNEHICGEWNGKPFRCTDGRQF